jgi:hypothetical protein
VFQLLEYYGRWHGFKGRLSQLPTWARLVLTVAALPGIVLIALSILAFLVSLLALLLLTVPLFRLLSAVCGVRPGEVVQAGFGGFGPPPDGMETVVDEAGPAAASVVVESPVEEQQVRPARRQIEVKIVE